MLAQGGGRIVSVASALAVQGQPGHADYAAANNIQCAVHMANSPLGQLASAHFAATIRNFMVLEYHAADTKPCPTPPAWESN